MPNSDPTGFCNLCGNHEFKNYRGRPNELCKTCNSKARHRVAKLVYDQQLSDLAGSQNHRVLHMAPEAALHKILHDQFGAGYICADPSPHRYSHAKCLKLFFPDDYSIFPDGYFSAILHNHVMEHLPGHFGDHLKEFARLLAPGGKMILSVPGPYLDKQTIEGGEHLATDAERLENFLQADHFKLLGADFVTYLEEMPGGKLNLDELGDDIRKSINVRPGKAPFYIWQKSS